MILKDSPEDFVVVEEPIDFSGAGDYVVVKVTKHELNTEDVAQLFTKRFGVPRKNIGYAGAKDRNAVTTQYFSLKGIKKEQLEHFTHENIVAVLVGLHNKPLSLGDLRGNRFEIVVRELERPLVARERVRNYYGEQRFGENNIKVGKLLLQKKFKEACEELGLPSGNPVHELLKLPKHTLMLYVHSYQSWLWNTALEHLDEPPATLPLIGFGTDLDDLDGEVKTIYAKLLDLEGITPRDFIIRQLPGVSPEGDERKTFIDVNDLVLGEFTDGVQKVTFRLPKGSYATVVIAQLAQ